MHKDFYAGGFILHPGSEQILLQQLISNSNASSPWHLIGGVSKDHEPPRDVFKKTIQALLDIEINDIFPIYSYNKENLDCHQHILYSVLPTKTDFPVKNGLSFAWFTFKEIIKIHANDQTKHDIIVGQRVIEAATRKRLGIHTFQ